ncbi:MAG: nucleotidyltransferase domain-containing protein [bacterium]|nr:nucleotidyltransferase domain-containing protein [bacterium]
MNPANITLIKKIKNDIVEKLKNEYNPERIILFGSYGYGKPTDDSDVDLLIVKDTNESFHQRIVTVRRLLFTIQQGFGLDVIVINPEELAKRLEIGDQFIEEITTKGEVLYAR